MTTATKPERAKPAPPKVFATITAPRSTWATALARVVGVVPHKGTLEVFKCVRLSVESAGYGLELRATDLETWCSTTVRAVDITGDTPPVCVPALLLAKAVNEMPAADVVLRVEEGKVTLTSGKVRVRIPTMPGEEFPSPPELGGVEQHSVSVKEFFGRAGRTEHAARKEVTSSPLMGVFVERNHAGWRFTATNGQRLSRHGAEGEALASAIVVPPSLRAAAKLLDGEDTVFVAVDQHHIWFRTPMAFCMARQLEGLFPELDYALVLKEPYAVVTCEASELLQAVRRAKLAADQAQADWSKVTLRAEGDGFLELSAAVQAGHEAGDTIGAEVVGAPFRVRLNADFVPTALKALDGLGSGRVRLTIPTSGVHAVHVRPVGKDGTVVPDALELIMPMRDVGD